MFNTIKSFSVGYNPLNKTDTFSIGDVITGQITLELTQDCKIDAICIKLKGKAEVRWYEQQGKTLIRIHSKLKYFSIKQVIIDEGNDLPPSFKSKHGEIVYSLEANLSRSMRVDSKAKAQFTLSRNWNLDSNPSLMTPLKDVREKKLKFFSSGTVSMDVNIDRTGFYPGEGITFLASIQNKSSRDIKPKYLFYMKCSYIAERRIKVVDKTVLKEVDDPIPPSADQAVTRVITIPPYTSTSILNCEILKVEYRLKVYLDVKYVSDPEIEFPIIILPALQGPNGEHLPACPTDSFQSP